MPHNHTIWNGGKRPVDYDTVVCVCFKFSPHSEEAPCNAGGLRWSHIGSNGDITSYRIFAAE